ncbi:MAG: AAA family ATPase [Bacilli bacterium]|nr:AAA family ATPase [Bacilli bacterium]
MIKKFSVKNFKGFKDELVFDLSNKRDYHFNEDQIKSPGIVNKGIIYGKNGSGKTNLGLALYDITSHLTDKPVISPMFTYHYINYEGSENNITFNYTFQFGTNEVLYHYKKDFMRGLLFEQIEMNNEIILSCDYRQKGQIQKNDNILGTKHLNFEIKDNRISILKYIYSNTLTNEKSPITKIMKFVQGMLWFRCLSEGNTYIGLKSNEENMHAVIIKNDKLKDFQDFLSKNGLNYNLVIKEINGIKTIFAQYKKTSAEFSTIISSGTKSLWLYYCWSLSFENVTFLYLDEFDAYYHYETAEYIFKALNSQKHFQSFVTTHNIYLMQNALTRPDCCFIISDNKTIKPLSDSTDKEIREAHNLEKMYKNGAFTDEE